MCQLVTIKMIIKFLLIVPFAMNPENLSYGQSPEKPVFSVGETLLQTI